MKSLRRWQDSERLHDEVEDLLALAQDWDSRVKMAESLEQLSLFETGAASPRDAARQAVLDLARFFEFPEALPGQEPRPVTSETLAELLNYVRHRHHLTQRAHFYAFIKEVDSRLAHDLRVLRNAVVHQSGSDSEAREQNKPSFLSKLARFLGLSREAADKEFRGLTNNDLEGIWDSLDPEEPGAASVRTQSIWELLLDCLVELVAARVSIQVAERRAPRHPHSPRENVILFGLWSGTPPPADVAAFCPICSYTSELRGNHAAFFRSVSGTDLQHRFFTSAA